MIDRISQTNILNKKLKEAPKYVMSPLNESSQTEKSQNFLYKESLNNAAYALQLKYYQ